MLLLQQRPHQSQENRLLVNNCNFYNKYSSFCANRACPNCLYKDRVFPRTQITMGKDRDKGKVCRICDRKFILYKSYDEYSQEIEHNEDLLLQNEQVLAQKSEQFLEAKQQLDRVVSETEEREKNARREEFEFKHKLDDLEREQEKLLEENQKLVIDQSDKQYDLKDRSETVSKLTMKVNQL